MFFFFHCCERHKQNSVRSEISDAEISKSRQVKPKLSAWLDSTRDNKKNMLLVILVNWPLKLTTDLIFFTEITKEILLST